MFSFITHNQRMIVCIFYIYPNVIHMFISGLLIYLKGDLPTFLLIRNYLMCLVSNITRNLALIYLIFWEEKPGTSYQRYSSTVFGLKTKAHLRDWPQCCHKACEFNISFPLIFVGILSLIDTFILCHIYHLDINNKGAHYSNTLSNLYSCAVNGIGNVD